MSVRTKKRLVRSAADPKQKKTSDAVAESRDYYKAARDYAKTLTKSKHPYIKTTGTTFLLWSKRSNMNIDKYNSLCSYVESLNIPAGRNVKYRILGWQLIVFAYFYGMKQIPSKNMIVFTPRKAGKSAIVAGLIMSLLAGKITDETGVQISNVAGEAKQSRIIYEQVRAVIRNTYGREQMSGGFFNGNDEIRGVNNSKFFPITTNTSALDGYSPSLCVVDECAESLSQELWSVLISSFSKALEFQRCILISTAGKDINCFFRTLVKQTYNEHKDNKTIKDKGFTFCPVLFAPRNDVKNIGDKRLWKQIHPAWDVLVEEDNYRNEYEIAKQTEGVSNFKRKRLNIWAFDETEDIMSAEQHARLFRKKFSDDVFKQGEVVMGIDPSRKSCLSAIALTTKLDGHFYVKLRHFITRSQYQKRIGMKQTFLKDELDAKRLIIDGDEEFSFDIHTKMMAQIHSDYNLKAVQSDMYMLGTQLADFTRNEMNMEYKVTNKERAQKTSMINVFEDAIQDNKIHVQYNPILSWEIGNCSRFSTDFGEKNYERKLKGDRIMATIDGVDAIVHSLHYYIKRKDTTLKSQGNGMAKLAERLKKL